MRLKAIFITGASRGIGKALALKYADSNIVLGLTAQHSVEKLELVAQECRRKGATVHTYITDVADQEKMKAICDDFINQAKTVDLVIANAGIALTEDNSFSNSAVALLDMQVNYLGTIHTFLPFVKHMIKLRSGHLVAVSSISSFRSTQNSGAYSASKAAVNIWTEGLRLRLKPSGISVSTLCVGFVSTEMTQNLKFWTPGLITAARAAILMQKAISKKSRLVTLPWQASALWATFFRLIPGNIYDLLIAWAKSRHSVMAEKK